LGDLLPELPCGLESGDNIDVEVGGGPTNEGPARAPSQSDEDLTAQLLAQFDLTLADAVALHRRSGPRRVGTERIVDGDDVAAADPEAV